MAHRHDVYLFGGPFLSNDDALGGHSLRGLGLFVALVGALFLTAGVSSFFRAIGTNEPPRDFWCVFVGVPILGLGLSLIRHGGLAGTLEPADMKRPVVSTALTDCPRCRASRPEGTHFCPECGADDRPPG